MSKRWNNSRFNFLAAVLLALAICFVAAQAAQAERAPWLIDSSPWNTADTGWFNNNSGESYDPYVISTANELAGLAKLVDEGNTFKYRYFVLANDIDLGGREWFPIGSFNEYNGNHFRAFSATFDGRGHKIYGLNVKSGRYGNLFGYIEDAAAVKNLVVEGRAAGSGTASDGAAILTAWLDGRVENCVISGDITRGPTIGDRFFGGIVASLTSSGKLINIITFGSVDSPSSTSYAGGLVGYTRGGPARIENCSVNVSSLKAAMDAGGLAGSNIGFVEDIYNNVAIVESMRATYIGGVAGLAYANIGMNNYWLKEPSNDEQPVHAGSFGGGVGTEGARATIAELPVVSVCPLKPVALTVGSPISLTAELYPQGGKRDGLTFEWKSSRSSVLSVSGSGDTATVTGVAEGKATLTLTMKNASWSGQGSVSVSCPVTVGTPATTEQPPSAPTSLSATPGDRRASISWSEPVSPGSSQITGYEVSSGTGEWVLLAASVRSYEFTGLYNDREYEFAARAVNDAGPGAVAMVRETPVGPVPTVKSNQALPASDSGMKAYAAAALGIDASRLTEDREGQLVFDSFEIQNTAREAWLAEGMEVDREVVFPLVYDAAGAAGDLAEFTFFLQGSLLMADRPENVLVMKIFGNDLGSAARFGYVSNTGDRRDGTFTVMKDGAVYSGEIEPNADYTLVAFVQDNGASGFDLDPAPQIVFDPLRIGGGRAGNVSPAVESSSGGGCSALGFPAILAAGAFLALCVRGVKRKP
jgi:hypothetical protein